MFSPRDLRAYALCTLFDVHSVEGVTPQMCDNALRALQYLIDNMRTTKGVQVEEQ
jgi:hypothetical protein